MSLQVNCVIPGNPPGNPSTPATPWEVPGLTIDAYDRDADNGLGGDSITCRILPGFAYDLFDFQTNPNPL